MPHRRDRPRADNAAARPAWQGSRCWRRVRGRALQSPSGLGTFRRGGMVGWGAGRVPIERRLPPPRPFPGRGGSLLIVLVAVFGLEALRLQPVLGQPAHHHRHAAVGDEHPFGPRARNRLLQARPIGVVRHHETAVHAAPPARAAQLHPAAREGIGIVAETAHPRRALGGRRRKHQCALQQRRIDARIGSAQRLRQRHARGTVDGVERLDRAMHDDGADRCIHAVQDALRLAEGIAEQHRGAPGFRIGAPPRIDLREQRGLRGPAVDRQTEGRLGDEGVAGHGLEGRAGAVGLGLVVARGDPHAPAVFEANLGRAQHMAGRVQRNAHAVMVDGFAIAERLQRDVAAEAGAQRAGAVGMRQVVRMADARMVRVRMRDDGPRHRLPGVDVEIARWAIQPLGARNDEIFFLRGHGPHRRRWRAAASPNAGREALWAGAYLLISCRARPSFRARSSSCHWASPCRRASVRPCRGRPIGPP
jgi:hypothetical protein